MTAPGMFPSFNLLGSFSWSSSSSSTPQGSSQASLPVSREPSLTAVLTTEISPSSPAATATYSSETRAKDPTVATCLSSATTFAHIHSAEEEHATAANASPRMTSSRRSPNALNPTKKNYRNLFDAMTRDTAIADPVPYDGARNTRSAASRRASVAEATLPHRRQPTAVAASFRLPAISTVVERLTFSGTRDGIDEGGSASHRRGSCLRGVRLTVSRLQPRAPLRDAAVSSVSCGCYIFLLTASLRFFFHCAPDNGTRLQGVDPVGKATAESTISSVSLASSPLFKAESPHPLVADPLLPVAKDDDSTLSLSNSSHPAELAFAPSSFSSFSSAFRCPAPCASPAKYATVPETSSAPPSLSSEGAFLQSAVRSAAPHAPFSFWTAFASGAAPAASLPFSNWIPAGYYHCVAYRLCAAWAAAGVCAAIAALLAYRSHGSIVIAASTLDVHFPIREELGGMDSEGATAEAKEEKGPEEEAVSPASEGQAAQAIRTVEEEEIGDGEEGGRFHGIRTTGQTAREEAESQQEVKRKEPVVDTLPQQSGTPQQPEGSLHEHADARQQKDITDTTVVLSQQQMAQQQQGEQPRFDRHPNRDHETGAGARAANHMCELLSEQSSEAPRSHEKYRRHSVYNAEKKTFPDHKRRRHKSSLGISFMGQGQIGSIASAIRRGSIGSALSGGGSTSTANRLQSVGSNASRSSSNPHRAFSTGTVSLATYGNPSSSSSGEGGLTASRYAGTSAPDNVPAAPWHSGRHTSLAQHYRDKERRNRAKQVWLCLQSPRQQQQQRMRQQHERMLQEQSEARLVPLLVSCHAGR